MSANTLLELRRNPTLKSLLVPLLTRPRTAQFIKWAVYLSLTVNFVFYLVDDIQVHIATLPSGAPLSELLTTYSTTIDTIAWLGLVYLFELETYALPDEAFKRWVTALLHTGRTICYVSIAFAAYGYTFETLENYNVVVADDIQDLCDVAHDATWLQTNSIDYSAITLENCGAITSDTTFYRIPGETALIPASVLGHIQWMGWIDVANAFVWLIVVLLIEIEVWMQAHDRFGSRALLAVRVIKTVFYLELIANGVIWLFTGYPLYAWDAFLWIFGFWAIELNLAEWERDRLQELQR